MTTLNLWIVFDHSPDDPRPPELVACGADVRPNEIVNVPLAYAENRYIGEYDDDGSGVFPWTETDAGIEQIQQPDYEEIYDEMEREQRRKRGE